MSAIPFVISARDGAARTGQLELAHGVVRTPAFMPVGTVATVKGMVPEAVAALGTAMSIISCSAPAPHELLNSGACINS